MEVMPLGIASDTTNKLPGIENNQGGRADTTNKLLGIITYFFFTMGDSRSKSRSLRFSIIIS